MSSTNQMVNGPSFALGKDSSKVPQWHMATGYALRNFHTQNILRFTRSLEKTSGDRLRITVYADGTLFKIPDILKAVEAGRVQLGEVGMSFLAASMPILGVDSLPFLTSSYNDARLLWQVSRPTISAELKKRGLIPLFAVPWPPQGLYVKKPVESIKDLRSMRFRTHDHTTARLAELIGATSISIQAADLAPAVAAGKVDAMFSSPILGTDIGAWHHFKYYIDLNTWIPKQVVLTNEKTMETITQGQESFMQIVAEAEDRGWKASVEKNKVLKSELSARGMEIVGPQPTLEKELHSIGQQIIHKWVEVVGTNGQRIIGEFTRKKTENAG